MSVASSTRRRGPLMLTTALLSPHAALAGMAAVAMALPSTSVMAQTTGQAATPVPSVTVETAKPKPRKPRPAVSRRSTTATPVPAAAPAATVPALTPAAASGPSVPANTSTISAAGAFSRALGTSDSASLVDLIPGGATWGAGGVSSLPSVNGQGADRVQVAVNGMLLGPACPNEMNPPLSFVNPAQISNLKAYVGVSPVSVGGDYTAGKIVVETAAPQFAPTPDWVTSATVSGFFRSINNSYGVDANASIANADTSVVYSGGWTKASDYKAADGTKIKSTLYETQNHALTIAKRTFGNQFTFQVGGQFIPYQGYVNQWMDMVYNRGLFANGKYEGAFDWGNLEATAFVHQVRHTMGFIEPDKTGNMPMDTRAFDTGYSVKATILASRQDLIRVGNELHYNHLDDWWDPVPGTAPMMGPNVFWNINDGRRARIGTFVEWERRWARDWTTVVGLRNDTVAMNTGPVQGYSAMMYGADATAFNKLDRGRTDVNIDGSALLRYTPDDWSVYELGAARKTRSPNLYERYTWSTNMMAMSMIGWFGDGNGYVGNVDLVPEKAHTASFTMGWHDPANKMWELKVTPYYTYVQDYIDVDRCPVKAGSMTCSAMNQTTTNNFVYLQFANHDAWLAGVNLAGKVAVWDDLAYGRGVLRGTLGYVRGQRTDGINLYHVMPINGRIGLDHTLGGWTNSVELQLVGTKNEVSEVRNELTTPGYALVNIRTGYQWKNVRVDAGIDNLFNKYYWLPLGGANLVNYDGAWGYSVLGPGRSFNGRVTVTF